VSTSRPDKARAERITIIGMNSTGMSFGLALKGAGLTATEIVGADGDRAALDRAASLGAVDRTSANLADALEGAALVIIAEDLSMTRDLLAAIGDALATGATVTDTSSPKAATIEWAETHLPAGVSFVGGHPLGGRPDETSATAFEGASYAIVPSKRASKGSIESVASMVELLGAKPVFMDAAEHDAFAAMTEILPALIGYAYLANTAGSPPWKDVSRFAGLEWAQIAYSAADPKDAAVAAAAATDATVNAINGLIEKLVEIRDLVRSRDERLSGRLIELWEARARWELGETSARPAAHESAGSFSSMILGRRLSERLKQIGNVNRRRKWGYPRKGDKE